MSKFNPDKPAQTVGGLPVRILKQDAAGDHPLVGVILHDDKEYPASWTLDGRYSYDYSYTMDLVNVTEGKNLP